MDELAIGDAVACLVPVDDVMGGVALEDSQLTFRPGVCHVYGYLDADKVSLGACKVGPIVPLHGAGRRNAAVNAQQSHPLAR